MYDATVTGLRAAFDDWSKALNAADLDAFYAFFDEDAEILDEDYPWRLDKADFQDHIAFHTGVWESFAWIAREVETKVWGTTGHVSGFSTFRGKPRDAGFRQRFMGFTTTWYHADGRWSLVSFHQSVLAGRIDGASPS